VITIERVTDLSVAEILRSAVHLLGQEVNMPARP